MPHVCVKITFKTDLALQKNKGKYIVVTNHAV